MAVNNVKRLSQMLSHIGKHHLSFKFNSDLKHGYHFQKVILESICVEHKHTLYHIFRDITLKEAIKNLEKTT